MLRLTAAVAVLAVGATFAYAQNLDVIKQRRDVMKTIAKSSGANFKMMKGETPFDLATVQAGLKVFQSEAPKFKTLFPDDAKTGGNTQATAKIWEKRADFDAAVDAFVTNAKAASTAITDEATFKTEYPKVAAGCGGCHKEADGFAPRLADSFKNMQMP
jgi:cytochrome c556